LFKASLFERGIGTQMTQIKRIKTDFCIAQLSTNNYIQLLTVFVVDKKQKIRSICVIRVPTIWGLLHNNFFSATNGL